MNQMIDLFWETFLNETNRDPNIKYINYFHFELTEYWANELLRLVLIGQKKATASSLYSYEIENERTPQVGDFNIITDWKGVPKCVIETTQITILPFKEITYDICKREGEDDTLACWQEGHRRFFIAEGKELGYEFSEEMMVVFEDFEVIYQVD